jgi:Flp pilus assembly protein CpaB
MKSNSLIYIIIAVIVVGAIAYFAMQGDGGPSVQNTNENTEAVTEAEQGMSMRDLVARGESVECTFNHTTDVSQSSGTVYVADGKVRGNFDVNATEVGQTFTAYMIADGGMSYVWSSMLPQGFMVPIAETSAEVGSEADGIDYNQKLDYSCEPWATDESFFVPPSTVTFIDVSTMQGAQ